MENKNWIFTRTHIPVKGDALYKSYYLLTDEHISRRDYVREVWKTTGVDLDITEGDLSNYYKSLQSIKVEKLIEDVVVETIIIPKDFFNEFLDFFKGIDQAEKEYYKMWYEKYKNEK